MVDDPGNDPNDGSAESDDLLECTPTGRGRRSVRRGRMTVGSDLTSFADGVKQVRLGRE
jgi:hypothetical protein